ncbi:MAG: L-threonylcarbamoyladenylate synthase [Candidatus Nanopelagicales bacterium]
MRTSTEPADAVAVLRAGGLVALPTETVYGLAADATDPHAVARVYAVKGRPADHPLIVHLASASGLSAWAVDVPGYARTLAAACWPGPLTLVLRRSARAGDHVTGGQDTVALRVPAHPLALSVLRGLDVGDPDGAPHGLAAPSANRFGRVSPTSAAHVLAELGPSLGPSDLVLDGGPSAVGVESTIVDCTGPRPRILRPGGVSAAEVERVTGLPVEPAGWIPAEPTGSGSPSAPEVRAPGTLASHYAPKARVVLAEGLEGAHLGGRAEQTSPGPASPDGLRAPAEPEVTVPPGVAGGVPDTGLLALAEVPTPPGVVRLSAPEDVAAYARVLYAALREADALGLTTVIAVPPEAADDRPRGPADDRPRGPADAGTPGPAGAGPTDPADAGLVAAIRDRLTRAAHPTA